MTAYELAEVMLPKRSVYHLQLVNMHPEVWRDLAGLVWGLEGKNRDDLPVLICKYGNDRDGFMPHRGSRRLCRECEYLLARLESWVDELRWQAACQIGYRTNDAVTRAFLARVGW